MKKITFLIACFLAIFQGVHSQSRTIKTFAQLVKKLNHDCNVSIYNKSAIYYAEYRIRGDSMLHVDYSNIGDTTLQKTLQHCLKNNANIISWHSILGVSDCSKTFSVIQPFVILSYYAKDEAGTDYTLSEVYKAFFSKLSQKSDIPFLLPLVYMEVSCFDCGPGAAFR